jgi:hypothetical protein
MKIPQERATITSFSSTCGECMSLYVRLTGFYDFSQIFNGLLKAGGHKVSLNSLNSL